MRRIAFLFVVAILYSSNADSNWPQFRAPTAMGVANGVAESSATVNTMSFRNRPRTSADRIVATARAKSLDLKKLPRFLLQATYWNAPVVDMQKLPGRSPDNP